MASRWKIIYYETPVGKVPVEEFINRLQEIPQAKVFNTLELLAELGREFLLLHAFTKKRQKTQKREIKTALVRLREYESRT